MKAMAFHEKSCIITGASSGIGRELALQLADQGAWLTLAARNEDRLKELAETCRFKGARVLVVPTDVREEDQCKALVGKAALEYRAIDMLVNNAGISMNAVFADMTDLSPMKSIMEINYYGSVYCTHYALPHLLESRGRLVGISSLTGRMGVPSRTFYAASKHAMMGFFDSLRIELQDTGVTVTMICPGYVTSQIRVNALGPDGQPCGKSHAQESRIMSTAECARQIVSAATSRRRELVMTPKAKVGQWVKLVAPKLVDNAANAAVKRGR